MRASVIVGKLLEPPSSVQPDPPTVATILDTSNTPPINENVKFRSHKLHLHLHLPTLLNASVNVLVRHVPLDPLERRVSVREARAALRTEVGELRAPVVDRGRRRKRSFDGERTGELPAARADVEEEGHAPRATKDSFRSQKDCVSSVWGYGGGKRGAVGMMQHAALEPQKRNTP